MCKLEKKGLATGKVHDTRTAAMLDGRLLGLVARVISFSALVCIQHYRNHGQRRGFYRAIVYQSRLADR